MDKRLVVGDGCEDYGLFYITSNHILPHTITFHHTTPHYTTSRPTTGVKGLRTVQYEMVRWTEGLVVKKDDDEISCEIQLPPMTLPQPAPQISSHARHSPHHLPTSPHHLPTSPHHQASVYCKSSFPFTSLKTAANIHVLCRLGGGDDGDEDDGGDEGNDDDDDVGDDDDEKKKEEKKKK